MWITTSAFVPKLQTGKVLVFLHKNKYLSMTIFYSLKPQNINCTEKFQSYKTSCLKMFYLWKCWGETIRPTVSVYSETSRWANPKIICLIQRKKKFKKRKEKQNMHKYEGSDTNCHTIWFYDISAWTCHKAKLFWITWQKQKMIYFEMNSIINRKPCLKPTQVCFICHKIYRIWHKLLYNIKIWNQCKDQKIAEWNSVCTLSISCLFCMT